MHYGLGLFNPFRMNIQLSTVFAPYGVKTCQKRFDLGRSPKIAQMRVIPNSRKKYLKNKLGPLLSKWTYTHWEMLSRDVDYKILVEVGQTGIKNGSHLVKKLVT